MAKKKEKTIYDAQKRVEQTASVMEHLFRAPKPVLLVIPILIASLIFGLLISFDLNDPYNTFFVNGIMILALPTFLSGITSVSLAESLGGKFYPRRSMLLSFLCLLILGGILAFFALLRLFFDTGIEIQAVVIFGFSAIIWLRHLTLVTTSNSSHLHSLPAALTQPILGFLFLAIFLPPFGTKEIILAVIFLMIFLIAVILLTQMVTSPMRKAFGVNGLSMVRYSLDHITEGGSEGAKEVEDFFESFAQNMDVHVGLVAFKKGDKIKAVMIVPSVHPGPFGLLGGSNLPLNLSESLKNKSKNVLVPHGSATHDLNLSSSKEKKKVAKVVLELLDKVEYSKSASKFIRIKDSMDVCAQAFGNGILLVHTSSPNPTDDVEHRAGNAIRDKVSHSLEKETLFIDAHNCAKRGSGCIYFGSKESQQLIDLAESASRKANTSLTQGIKVGYSQKTGYVTEKGIGKSGIQVLVTETNNQKAAYILFDGNNMISGLRDSIIVAIKDLVDDAEVLTTDNHAVNATIGGYNPVGLRMEKENLVSDAKALVKSALKDLEEVEVGMATGCVKNVNVFGHENVTRLSSVVNSTVAALKIKTFMSLLLAVVASALVFLFV
ncbi:MAG: DUF2070 family protein [Thermoplasmata archaeon]|nr:MAG: DUF2070 family protein [Thermoplasmata archaeon]